MVYIEVIELGKKKLILRDVFDGYCRSRESYGMEIVTDINEKKIYVGYPENLNIKTQEKISNAG